MVNVLPCDKIKKHSTSGMPKPGKKIYNPVFGVFPVFEDDVLPGLFILVFISFFKLSKPSLILSEGDRNLNAATAIPIAESKER